MKYLICFTLFLGLGLAYEYNEKKPAQLNCDCGWSNTAESKKRILGGTATERNEYPWMAAIVDSGNYKFQCAGTIITNQHVLTISTCTDQTYLRPSSVLVCIGANNARKCNEDPDGKLVDIKKITIKFRYSKYFAVDNIAVVLMKNPIKFGSKVGPACFPHLKVATEEMLHKQLKVVGWGGTEYVKELDVNVVPLTECMDYSFNRMATTICTFSAKGHPCLGDGGSPLLLMDPEIQRYTIYAMISHGPPDCEVSSEIRSLNANVAHYISWIKKQVKETKGPQLCIKK